MGRYLLIAIVATSGWASTTYTFSANNYSTIGNFASCSTGPCASYTTSMKISGSFTLASPLPPNFSGGDITSRVIAYSFTDGVNTITNSDPSARVFQFGVTTDASGNINVASILVEKWQSGSSPHTVGDRFAQINLNGPTIIEALNNLPCIAVGGGTASGVSDLCLLTPLDSSSSSAFATLGSWSVGPNGLPTTPVPPSFILALIGLVSIGLYQFRRLRFG
jgi:hypothetical protein